MRKIIRWAMVHPKGAAVLAGVLVLLVIAGVVDGNTSPKRPAADQQATGLTSTAGPPSAPTSTARPSDTAATRSSTARVSTAPADRATAAATAVHVLATLPVKGRAP